MKRHNQEEWHPTVKQESQGPAAPEPVSAELKYQRLSIAAAEMFADEIRRAKEEDERAVLIRLEKAFVSATLAGVEAMPLSDPLVRSGYFCVNIPAHQRKSLPALAHCFGMSLQAFIGFGIFEQVELVETALGITQTEALEMGCDERRVMGKRSLMARAALRHFPWWAMERN